MDEPSSRPRQKAVVKPSEGPRCPLGKLLNPLLYKADNGFYYKRSEPHPRGMARCGADGCLNAAKTKWGPGEWALCGRHRDAINNDLRESKAVFQRQDNDPNHILL